MMSFKTLLVLELLVILSFSRYTTAQYPQSSRIEPLPPLAEYKGIKIMDGGYGSSLAFKPGQSSHLYLLTDRGPNYDTGIEGEKVFAVSDYVPHIGEFEIKGDGLKLVKIITIRDSAGNPINGLPNPVGIGGTGEKPVDAEGNKLKEDPRGLDSEGLVALADGSFWISDEYGPHLLHIDRSGKTIERINPFTKGRSLPKVFARRRPNRGMEGLAITPDQKYIVGIMQSSIYNPDKSMAASSRVARILFFDIKTGKTKQYVYLLERPNLMNTEITAISNTQFLVIERDDYFFGGNPKAEYKRVYKIDTAEATDVSDAGDRDTGLLFDGKTLEQLTADELDKFKIKAVKKELVLDLLQCSPPFPHDKPEGIAVLGKDLIAICNDDDFGVTLGKEKGSITQKRLPSGEVDTTHIYFYRLARPLY